jgi:uncharacterized membrane protein
MPARRARIPAAGRGAQDRAVELVGVLRVVATVGCGLVGGLLLVFSAGIMTALGRTPGGAEAMRAINAAVLNPLFLGVFTGTAVACAALVGTVAVTGGPALLAVAGAVHLVGVFGVTAARSVPMNDALAAGRLDWPTYRRAWTGWNHVRTAAAVAATVLLAAGA